MIGRQVYVVIALREEERRAKVSFIDVLSPNVSQFPRDAQRAVAATSGRTKERSLMRRKQMKRKKTASPINFILGILNLIYVMIAIRQQLQLPAEERTWYDVIAGIPYDFRLPTVDRIRATYWNKDTSKIFLPQAFGIGWGINVYPIIHPKEVQELQ